MQKCNKKIEKKPTIGDGIKAVKTINGLIMNKVIGILKRKWKGVINYGCF